MTSTEISKLGIDAECYFAFDFGSEEYAECHIDAD